jgi:thioredoxin 1
MERAEPLDVTDDTYEQEVIKSEIPVVVEFWSPECTHCQHMGGIVNSLAKEFGGRVKVAKVNILENPALPMRYEVTGIPRFFLINKGHVAADTLGAMAKGKLKKELGLDRI